MIIILIPEACIWPGSVIWPTSVDTEWRWQPTGVFGLRAAVLQTLRRQACAHTSCAAWCRALLRLAVRTPLLLWHLPPMAKKQRLCCFWHLSFRFWYKSYGKSRRSFFVFVLVNDCWKRACLDWGCASAKWQLCSSPTCCCQSRIDYIVTCLAKNEVNVWILFAMFFHQIEIGVIQYLKDTGNLFVFT